MILFSTTNIQFFNGIRHINIIYPINIHKVFELKPHFKIFLQQNIQQTPATLTKRQQ